MPKYIEREIIINDIEGIIKILKKPPIREIDKKLIETFELWKLRFLNTPTDDVVKVVRCGQCGNYCKNTGECNLYGTYPNKNEFCSSGIKKECYNNA